MILVPRKNLYLPERRWGQKKYQRGIIGACAVSYDSGPVTSLAGDQASHTRIRSGANCYAGVSLNSDGNEWAWSNDGTASGTDLGAWLDRGDPAALWAYCTLNSGVLDGSNSGVGSWIVMSSILNWAILRDSSGTDTADIDIDIATDSGGSNIIDSANYTLSATWLV